MIRTDLILSFIETVNDKLLSDKCDIKPKNVDTIIVVGNEERLADYKKLYPFNRILIALNTKDLNRQLIWIDRLLCDFVYDNSFYYQALISELQNFTLEMDLS